jgi:hypothetical protein
LNKAVTYYGAFGRDWHNAGVPKCLLFCPLSAAARQAVSATNRFRNLRSRAFSTIVGEITFGKDATHYFGVLAVTSTSMSIPGHASAVTTRNVPAGWVAPAYASARHLPASKK